MSKKNCPNCAAPYDVELHKCPYCGTSYYDMSALDFESGEPIFLKIKTRMGDKTVYLTQKVVPRLGDITFSDTTCDITGRSGEVIRTIVSGKSINTNVEFLAIPMKNDHMIEIEVNE